MSSQQDISPKRAWAGTSKIGFSPFPTAKPCPLTSDPWPHHVLYWLGTGWWCLGLAHASLPCVSKTCLLLMCLPWLACSICRSSLTVFQFPFLLWLALLRARPCLMMGFAFSFSPFFSVTLLPYHSVIPAAKLFASILLGLFGPIASGSVWPLVSLITLLYGLPCPICFPLGILGSFAFLGLPWPFS